MPRPQLMQQKVMPPPFGMNLADPAVALPDGDGTYLINVVNAERGLKPRPGSQEWALNVGTGEVRSIHGYHGSSGSANRLFATTQDKIYNATAQGTTPTAMYTFGTSNTISGYGTFQSMALSSGRYVAYCDEANGYLLYTEATDTWTVPTITGAATAGVLVQCLLWKGRLWFVKSGTSEAYYLGTDAIQGAVSAFYFGRSFPNGGYLVGLYNWTRDGGAGMDDVLVAVSSAGDVVAYAGTDPSSSATFENIGQWNVGGVPIGRKLAYSHGGDLLLLTTQGLVSMTKLLSGQPLTALVYETEKIRPLIQSTMALQKGLRGWEVRLCSLMGAIIINTPGGSGTVQEQYAMTLARRGWSRLYGWDMLCSTQLDGDFYWGTRTGKVMKATGYVDNISYTGSTTNILPIQCAALFRFEPLADGNNCILRFVEPAFSTHGVNPAYNTFARFDFDFNEPAAIAAATPVQAGPLWDVAQWDVATWADFYGNLVQKGDAEGMGDYVAAGIQWTVVDYAVLTALQIGWEKGGPL